MSIVGYARVSTSDQNPRLQFDALRAAGCDTFYTETASGRRYSVRPQLDLCLSMLQPGDTLVVWRLDRLGRNTGELVRTVTDLAARGVAFRCLIEGLIDTTTANGRMMLGFFAVLAEFESNLIRERTIDGLAAARARGHVGGRRPVLVGAKLAVARSLYAQGEGLASIARTVNVSRTTVTRALGGGTKRAQEAVNEALGDHSDLRAGRVDRWTLARSLYASGEHRVADLARAIHLPRRRLLLYLRAELLDADARQYARELEEAAAPSGTTASEKGGLVRQA